MPRIQPNTRIRRKHKKECGCKERAVAYVGRQEDAGINAVEEPLGEWERIPIKIDSGAIDTVIPKEVGTYFPIRETEASKSGTGFKAANGSHIANHGERRIEGLGEEWNPIGLRAQVADVKTALGSVYQMIRAGNSVHLEAGNCYINNLRTGKRTPIREKNGTFEISIWVPSGPVKHKGKVEEVKVSNRYQTLQEEEDEGESDFIRQDAGF